MRIGIIASNHFPIDEAAIKGTEIFVYAFIRELAKRVFSGGGSVAAFCSGDSILPIRTETIQERASAYNSSLPFGKHVLFELALIEKAFRMEREFDLFHVHIGNGDIALPFVPFIKKPVLVTLHYTLEPYAREFFLRYKDVHNLHFVSISDAQRFTVPELPYRATIYHGIDEREFAFDARGGEAFMWAGRGVPEKGIEDAVQVSRRAKRPVNLFAVRREEHAAWFEHFARDLKNAPQGIAIHYDTPRKMLIPAYQQSKAFVFPIQWEEPFGLVMVEAMSCGTPAIAYARGSAPEIIEDGVTGFLVNPSDTDRRGAFCVKKSGIPGIVRAVERVYGMSAKEYESMRRACRKRVEERFTIQKMMDAYEKVYEQIVR